MRTDFKQLRATDTLLYPMEQIHAWYPKRSHVLVVQKDDKETYYFLMTRAEFAKQVRRAWTAHDYGRTLAEVLRIRASDASRTTDAGGKLQNPTKPTVVLANGKAAGYLPGKGSGGALAPVTSLPYPVLLTGPPKTPVGKGVGRDAVLKKGGGDGGRRIAVKGPVVKSGAPAKTAVPPKKVAAKKSMAKRATSRYTARAKPPARSGSRASEIYVPSEPRAAMFEVSPPVAVTGGSGGCIECPMEYELSPPRRLHFVLQGEHARGAAMLANSDAELVFRFDIPPADALATTDSAALDAARQADIDIELRVTARGAISLMEARSGTARFRGGRMLAPIVFPIRAGSSTDAGSSLYVDFSVKGESVYQIEMPIRVVARQEDLYRSPARPSTERTVPLALLREALAAPKPPQQRIHLSLAFDGGRFCIELSDLRDGEIECEQRYTSKAIDRARLETLLKTVHTELGPCYQDEMWSRFDGSVPPGDSGRVVTAALKRTLETVAIAGSRLYQDLGTDAEIKNALCYIEQIKEPGAVITVATDDIFLPWEIIYPGLRSANMTQAQKDDDPLQPESFWGARFAIETVQRGSGSLGELRRLQLASAPAVSLNLTRPSSSRTSIRRNSPLPSSRPGPTGWRRKGISRACSRLATRFAAFCRTRPMTRR